MYYFIDSGYARIAEMQKMEAIWQKKAPIADISICDGKPCVKVDTNKIYGDKNEAFLIIKKWFSFNVDCKIGVEFHYD